MTRDRGGLNGEETAKSGKENKEKETMTTEVKKKGGGTMRAKGKQAQS